MTAFIIREEAAKDQDGIRQMYRLAFGGTAVAKLADDLRKTRDAIISLVALKEEQVIGHIMLSRLKTPANALTLAPLAVHPDFQRQGIGAALIRKGLDRAKQDGCTAIFVVGDTGYYERLGFVVNVAEGFPSPYAGGRFMLLSLDPENTSTVDPIIYPSPSTNTSK